jgi:hypothetical protein
VLDFALRGAGSVVCFRSRLVGQNWLVVMVMVLESAAEIRMDFLADEIGFGLGLGELMCCR